MARALRIACACALVLLLGVCALGFAYEPNTALPAGFRGRHVSVSGVPLRVLQEGSGRDVLLIHGSPGSIEDWSSLMPTLRRQARVTAFDRPNHGYSGATGDDSLAHHADMALSLIAKLGLRDVVVVGHSYGGATALAMALAAPASVAAYVVLDSATYTASRRPTAIFHVLRVPGLGTGLARLSGERLAAPRIAAGIREQYRNDPPASFIELRTRIWSSPKVTRAIAGETLGAPAFLAAQSPRYPQIRARVRIVAQADDALRRESAARLHRDIPGSTLRLLPNTGHYVQFERPAEVLEEIGAALSDR
jgi:pimeloyl-ACP methyl ester carboxylesterase